VQRQARAAHRLFSENPSHPSLRFKQVHSIEPIFSVRVNRNYRALGVRGDDQIVWFWIGSHTNYDKLISRLS
jgi:hypothetical protein